MVLFDLYLLASFAITTFSEGDQRECNEWQECMYEVFPTTDDELLQNVVCNGAAACQHSTITAKYDVSCNGYESCKEALAIHSSEGDVFCMGPSSCHFNPEIATLNGAVSCSGDNACFKSSISTQGGNKIICDGCDSCVQAFLSATDSVAECSGHTACTQTLFVDTLKTATCSGFYGCFKSKIEIGDGEARCYGGHSCQQSTITATSIAGYGAYALNRATINTGNLQGNAAVTVEAFGYFAGQGATVTCSSGKTCDVYCAGNGCFEMNVVCEAGSDCNVHCDAENGVLCPVVVQDNDDETVIAAAASALKLRRKLSHAMWNQHTFDDAYLTVADPPHIISEAQLKSNKLCKGHLECSDAENGVRMENGGLTCTGYESCAASELYASKALTCSGYKSCVSCSLSTKLDGGDIECNGHQSCFEAASIVSGQNVKCMSGESCASTAVHVRDSYRVHCDGPMACSQSKLEADAGDVHCNGLNACTQSLIMLRNTAWCNGHQACMDAEVSTIAGSLECHGTFACKNAAINVKTLRAFGYLSLQNAVIDSRNVAALHVEVYGYMAGSGATLECQPGSQCMVYCMGNACEDLQFNCRGSAQCDYQCDAENGDACPTFAELEDDNPIARAEDGTEDADGDKQFVVQDKDVQSVSVKKTSHVMTAVFIICSALAVILIFAYSRYPRLAQYKEYGEYQRL